MQFAFSLRFNEWGRAIVGKQIEELKAYHSGASHQCWRFMGISHPEDLDVSVLSKHVAGLYMQAGSDKSQTANAKSPATHAISVPGMVG